jgi:hypothetical protein
VRGDEGLEAVLLRRGGGGGRRRWRAPARHIATVMTAHSGGDGMARAGGGDGTARAQGTGTQGTNSAGE